MGKKYMEDIVEHLTRADLIDRRANSEGHKAAKEYLVRALEELQFKPGNRDSYLQSIKDSDGDVVGENIIGIMPGKSNSYLLVAAHYDTFYDEYRGNFTPGADDNAAAIAIVLNILKNIEIWDSEAGLAILFCDLEEPPNFHEETMGSTYFYNNCPLGKEQILCAIVLDLVGHDVPLERIKDALFITGAEGSRVLVDAVKKAQEGIQNLSVYPVRNQIVGNMSDHHVFQENNRPFLFLSCGEWEHYHQPSDTKEKLNYEKMESISQLLKGLIMYLSQRPYEIDEHTNNNCIKEFLEIEADSYSRVLGLPVPPVESVLSMIGPGLRTAIVTGKVNLFEV